MSSPLIPDMFVIKSSSSINCLGVQLNSVCATSITSEAKLYSSISADALDCAKVRIKSSIVWLDTSPSIRSASSISRIRRLRLTWSVYRQPLFTRLPIAVVALPATNSGTVHGAIAPNDAKVAVADTTIVLPPTTVAFPAITPALHNFPVRSRRAAHSRRR